MAQRMQRIKAIRTHTVLAENEKVIGKHTTGQDIIARTYMKDVKEPVLDKNGEQVWKYDRDRNPLTRIFRNVPTEVTEIYVWDELKTGHNRRNYGFRPTDEELVQRDQLQRAATLQEEYWKKAAERGLTADALLDAVETGAPKPPAQEPLGDGHHVVSADESMEAEIARRVEEGIKAALASGTSPTATVVPRELSHPETRAERDVRIARNTKARERRARAKETAGV